MSWKYIIVRAGNQEVPLFFPQNVVHSMMAECAKDYFVRVAIEMSGGILTPRAVKDLREQLQVVSAGEVTLEVGNASGRSETLGVSSRDMDTVFLRSYPYHHGVMP